MLFDLTGLIPDERTQCMPFGIVAADSIEAAAAKIGLAVKNVWRGRALEAMRAELEDGYFLEETPELTNPADLAKVVERWLARNNSFPADQEVAP